MIGSGPLGASPLAGPGDDIPGIAVEGAISYEIVGQLAAIRHTAKQRHTHEITIKQGDSLALMYGLGDSPLWDWTCDIAIKASLTDTDVIYEAVIERFNEDGTFFQALLPRTVTQDWAAGTCYVIADLYNSETGEAKEFQDVLVIEAQALTQE